MEPVTKKDLTAIATRDTWSVEDHRELLEVLLEGRDAPGKLRILLAQMEAANPDPGGAAALKIGIVRYMLCRFRDALDVLGSATDNKERHYFLGQCHKLLQEYDKAAEDLVRARDRGWDHVEIYLEMIELQALSGSLDEAAKALGKLKKSQGQTAGFLYVSGLIHEISGNVESAIDNYNQARSIDADHVASTFHLAYCYDLYGEEEEAMALYKECSTRPPVHANALLNLAVLYEDAGQYDMAIATLRRILAANPNHSRARLFLKDAQASKSMYYDEDQARLVARRNAVLDIPVTDFELSVRARNCLKKMNIRTLGDLVRITEAELLTYKNFGETSLKEIKDMLTAKGLRLGQEAEESPIAIPNIFADIGPVANDAGETTIPLDQVKFSIRVRRALQNLNIQTLGELGDKSEAELMACNNFGQTSLTEVIQRLADHGLKLRESS